MRGVWRVATATALVVVPSLVGVNPAGAVPTLASGVGAAAVPMVTGPVCSGSSLCNGANLPILQDLAEGMPATSRLPVTAARAAQGGYWRTYGGSGLSGEALGGASGLALGSLGMKALHYGDTDEVNALPSNVWNQTDTKVLATKVVWVNNTTHELNPQPVNIAISWSFDKASYPSASVSTSMTIPALLAPAGHSAYSWPFGQTEYKCGPGDTWTLAPGGVTGASGTIRTGGSSVFCGASGVTGVRVVLGYAESKRDVVFAIPLGPGSPGWQANPPRWLERTIDCVNGAGDHKKISAQSETSSSAVTGWSLPDLQCPAGYSVVGDEVVLHTQGLPDVELDNFSVPDEYRKAIEGEGGHCLGQPGKGDCKLEVKHLRTSGRVDDEPVTRDWASHPDDYACRYGGRTIPIEYCLPYSPEVPPRSDEDTVPAPVEDPARPGNPLLDPPLQPRATPTPTPHPSGSGNPTPTPEPSGTASPSPSASQSGGVLPTPTPTPTPTGTPVPEDYECPSFDFSIKGVLSGKTMFQAVACALGWAFVPSPVVVQEQVESLHTAWDESGPMVLIGDISDVGRDLGGVAGNINSGCAGPSFELGGKQVFPVSACNAPISGLAAGSRVVTAGIFGVMGLMKGVGVFMHTFGLRFPWNRPAEEQLSLF